VNQPTSDGFQWIKDLLKVSVWRLGYWPRQGHDANVFIFTSRRGGGTWLAETLASIDGACKVIEPLERGVHNHFIPTQRFLPMELARQGGIALTAEEAEDVISFLSDIVSFRYRYMREWNVTRDDYAFFPKRNVIKVHNAKHLMSAIMESFPRDRFVFQIRHPIAQAISAMRYGSVIWSRRYLECEQILEVLPPQAHELAWKILDNDSSLLMHYVLDWALENMIPLHLLTELERKDLTAVTYEEMVLAPEDVAFYLSRRTGADRAKVAVSLNRPSKTTDQQSVRQLIREQERMTMLSRWQGNVSDRFLEDVQALLDSCGISLYSAGDPLPKRPLAIRDSAWGQHTLPRSEHPGS